MKYSSVIMPGLYKFTIQNPNVSESEERAGFIDPMKTTEYVDFDKEMGTEDQYKAKSLGYIRWNNLALALSQFNVCGLTIDVVDGATSLDVPTSITFIVAYDSPESIMCEVDESLFEESEDVIRLRDGRVFFKGVKALKEIVANVMIKDFTMFTEVYTPVKDTFGLNSSLAHYGFSQQNFTAKAICESREDALNFITVEKIEETEA